VIATSGHGETMGKLAFRLIDLTVVTLIFTVCIGA
jgi:hypothetical protein